MMNAIRLFAALLVLGLGGCANYPMGSLKTDLLPAEDVAAGYSLNTAWWKGYHDADLDRIVALALERNVDLALSCIRHACSLRILYPRFRRTLPPPRPTTSTTATPRARTRPNSG